MKIYHCKSTLDPSGHYQPRSSNSTDSVYLLFSMREKGFVFYFDAPLMIGVDAKDEYPLFSKRE